ncbi:MAG: hypothetical protein H6736_12680 [Alphaproteobacteria bacterium]|nr:hypothetical protein [Alphaproteobacteria bacterium]
MPAINEITRPTGNVNAAVVQRFADRARQLLEGSTQTGRSLEKAVWEILVETGREMLTAGLAKACWEHACAANGGSPPSAMRLDDDYWLSQATTLGTVTVPLFAHRDETGTHAPAREAVFPLHPHCRSSELLLEWETRLGAQLPFRRAQEELGFFTHGAVGLEDTTIARHIGILGRLADRQFQFRSLEDFREILMNRATRDQRTSRPIVYISTDAHSLRRYVDDTWKAAWRNINGIRVWCVDQKSGKIVHLGGEYTWGDCQEVKQVFRSLSDEGYLPRDGCYDGLRAQFVFLADGMPWIWDHVAPELPEDTVEILDFYHAMNHIASYANARFGAESALAKAWYNQQRAALLGKRAYRRKKGVKRKGHKKRCSRRERQPRVHRSANPHGAGEALVRSLLDEPAPAHCDDEHTEVVRYTGQHAHRMDYPAYRERGFQIGSGAMESLHRTGSQLRVKRPGTRWLPENALSVIRVRMMMLADRWTAFWESPDLTQRLVHAFRSGGPSHAC